MCTGVDVCQQWKPIADLPDHALTETAIRALPISEDETRNKRADDDHVSKSSVTIGSSTDGNNRAGPSLQAPCGAVMIPIRPTLVELGGRSRPVDSMDDARPDQQMKSKQNKQKQQPDQQLLQRQQQQSDPQQQKMKPKEQHKQKLLQQQPQQRFQMQPQQQHIYPGTGGGNGMMNRMTGPMMMVHQPRR